MMDMPATPSPHVSDSENMDTDEKEDLLAYHGIGRDPDSSDEDGFQHV